MFQQGLKVMDDWRVIGAIEIVGPSHSIQYPESVKNSVLDCLRIIGSPIDLSFNNCIIKELDVSADYGRNISLINCSIKHLRISTENGLFQIGKLEITGAQTKIDKMEITQGSIQSLSITEPEGFGELNILNTSIGTLNLSVMRSGPNINCKNPTITAASVNNCTSLTLNVDNGNIHQLEVSKCSACTFNLTDTSGAAFRFFENRVQSIDFKSSEIKKVALESGTFDTLWFHNKCDISLHTEIGESKTEIREIRFENCELPTDGMLSFVSISIKILYVYNLRNRGRIYLQDSTISEYLIIQNSDVGKFDFDNIDLSDKTQFNIATSAINEARFNSFSWPNGYKFYETWEGNKNEYQKRFKDETSFLLAIREGYRQLKSNHLKIDNKIIALEFQKNEMRMQYEIVKKNWNNSWADRANFLIVGTHKWVSDFGQNIWKPFLLLLIVHLVLFVGLLYSNPDLNLRPFGNITLDATCDGVSKYFQTLLLTHGFSIAPYSDNSDEASTSWVSIGGVWDTAIRIFSAYFIFYFISASRKYHQ